MATANSGSIIFVQGRLSWNGTPIGTCRGIRFQPRPKYRDIWAEEWGSVSDSVYAGEGPCTLSAIVRYPDTDAIQAAAPKSLVGSAVHWLFRPGGTSGNTRAGTLLSSKAGVLLFTPHASALHPAIKLYNALPQIAEDAELRMSLGEEYGLGLRFVGSPDSNGKVYDSGLLADL